MKFKLKNNFSEALILGLGLVLVGLCLLNIDQAKPPAMPKRFEPPKIPFVVPPKLPELPGGGRILSGQYRLVALYGTPSYPALGVLGEQNLNNSIKRVKQLAADYQTYSQNQKIMAAFEIIATVASAYPTADGDYSAETSVKDLEPWVQGALKAGVYVILDLQPGRQNFLVQAKTYAPLLLYPNVGLALDPEWRLRPNQVHLRQIGSVNVDEVQAVADWLSQLTKENNLPQKLFLLHQFRPDMITGREKLMAKSNLSTVIQMDGQGSAGAKDSTWQEITKNPPLKVSFGWKNFYDEDTQLRSPKDTMNLKPTPVYVSYQ